VLVRLSCMLVGPPLLHHRIEVQTSAWLHQVSLQLHRLFFDQRFNFSNILQIWKTTPSPNRFPNDIRCHKLPCPKQGKKFSCRQSKVLCICTDCSRRRSRLCNLSSSPQNNTTQQHLRTSSYSNECDGTRSNLATIWEICISLSGDSVACSKETAGTSSPQRL
jgi:hypothetical protein